MLLSSSFSQNELNANVGRDLFWSFLRYCVIDRAAIERNNEILLSLRLELKVRTAVQDSYFIISF